MSIPFQPSRLLEAKVLYLARSMGIADEHFEPDIRPADPRFGDLQANGILSLAKRTKQNPRELAQTLANALSPDSALSEAGIQVAVAGPGFINFTFTPTFLLRWLRAYRNPTDLRSGASALLGGTRVVVDFSGPNSAKQMHVGHIRSTVIGEAIARLLEFAGAEVIRDNHIGDWGTQFGILIMAWKKKGVHPLPDDGEQALAALEDLYREGNRLCEENPAFRETARSELLKLQQGDAENLELWKEINRISYQAFASVYERLGIRFDHVLGESFYRDKLSDVYRELTEVGLAKESEGALVVFHPEHPRFATQPLIIRKSDGASNYATTDLATVLYRTETLKANRMTIVTDGRQKDHFAQIFLTVQKWFAATGRSCPELDHVWFGTILGENNKAIKTRSGESIKLMPLLDEAVRRAQAMVGEKNPELPPEEQARVAEVVGTGAVRYSDLAQNRTQDYVFSWDKMLRLEGNTAPYLLYAVARIHGIFRKASLSPGEGESGATPFSTETEIALARKLIGFPHAIDQSLQDLRPHFLCTYLYELSGVFSAFYNADRVMHDDPSTRSRRLVLAARTLVVLETGLNLLGLETLERM